MNRQEQQQQFDAIYQQLNPAQKAAVDALEGPVMVIAGPGTGKTQILSARIGKILLETDARPNNILCLTYTDAGAVAMRKRLFRFIGADAYQVNLYTFHAFCNDIIQDNLSLFQKNALDPISDLERIEYLKELIDRFPKTHPLKRFRGDVYYEINNLSNLFSNMKREGWTSKMIEDSIEAYLNDLPERPSYRYQKNGPNYKKGDLKMALIEAEQEKMTKLRAAVGEFSNYQTMMQERNRYDFDDMINWVIAAFENNPNLLSRYQEQYLYILVDEYQDTSGTQNKIVELLANYWDQPNVFVVGDDDQSIYRFQGANVANMKEFADRYSAYLKTVVLTQNYRSVQPILDVSKELIEKNKERLIHSFKNLSKELIASNEALKDLNTVPEVHICRQPHEEMVYIAHAVAKLIQQGAQPAHIAVLYKENKYGEELTQYFQCLDIPAYSKRSLNLLDIPLIQQLVNLLTFLSEELDRPYSGDEKLFEILHYNWWKIPPIEVAKITVENFQKNTDYSRKTKSSIRLLMSEKVQQGAQDLFTPSLHPSLAHASQVIEQLLTSAVSDTLQQLVENAYRLTGMLHHILNEPDKHWNLQVLTNFFQFIKEETRRKPSMNLAELVEVLSLMKKEGLRIPIQRTSGSDQGVHLLTAHGSKGLEYDYVFIAGCNAGFWEKKRKPAGGYTIPDTLIGGAAEGDSKEVEHEELRRLFFVAITRAAKQLVMTYSLYNKDGKDIEPTMFLAEILEKQPLPQKNIVLTEDDLSQMAILQWGENKAPILEKLEEEFVAPLLDKFSMNVTALNNFLKCPLEFYYKNLLRIPSPKNENTEFGSAVHWALEQWFKAMKDDGQHAFPNKATLISYFKQYMDRNRESFTPLQFTRRMEYGEDVLSRYYDERVDQLNKVVVIEHNIRNVVVDGIPLKGKLDKLEFNGLDVNVVDYKTGNPDNSKDKLKPPSEKDPNGGDYWRQAVFYQILIHGQADKNWRVVSTEFDFVEPNQKKQLKKEKVIIRPEDTTTVVQQIKSTWEAIQKRAFYTGCGKADCHWCNFVEQNKLAVDWKELETEEE